MDIARHCRALLDMFRYYKILFSEFIGIACSSIAKLLKLPFIVRVNLFEGLRRVSGIFRGDPRLKRYSTHASLVRAREFRRRKQPELQPSAVRLHFRQDLLEGIENPT